MTGAADEAQRRVTRLLLAALDGAGCALAGAEAVRAHGLTDRPTEDVDLFSGPRISKEAFRAAVASGEQALREAGYETDRVRESPMFVRLRLQTPDGHGLDVDFAVNWRADPPVQMNLGPVLSERDAVAGKLSAVYSRGEVRDFLDLDAIRASGRYADEALLTLGTEHDADSIAPCSPPSSHGDTDQAVDGGAIRHQRRSVRGYATTHDELGGAAARRRATRSASNTLNRSRTAERRQNLQDRPAAFPPDRRSAGGFSSRRADHHLRSFERGLSTGGIDLLGRRLA